MVVAVLQQVSTNHFPPGRNREPLQVDFHLHDRIHGDFLVDLHPYAGRADVNGTAKRERGTYRPVVKREVGDHEELLNPGFAPFFLIAFRTIFHWDLLAIDKAKIAVFRLSSVDYVPAG